MEKLDKLEFENKIANNEYAERFAKFLLADVYNAKFKNAKQSDRPDIQYINAKASEGMEVTSLADVYYNTLKRYKRLWGKSKLTLEEIVSVLPSILRGSLTINRYGNIVFIQSSGKNRSVKKSQQDIIATLNNKLAKLQKYKQFDKNNLLIFAPNLNIACNADRISEALKFVDKSKYNYVYDNVLVVTFDTLSVFPFKHSGRIQIYGIDKHTRESCDERATKDMPQIVPKNKKKLRTETQYEPCA